ncbi:lactococcin 972 family bacteriocin [Streptomyces rishiriensis]|uniref:lactococcin 972 family bacteriocin n=1 Tax=Streptomyces rishiriensis TaxID=68264 RepID=UPI000D592642|nr:lactococcin 972 family bacteriocin [Streptomyces rishiriensis]
MNKRTGVKAALACTAIIFAAATPAMAITVDRDGGKWSYDEGANSAWSNFKHPNNKHASSVQNNDQISRSGCTAAGVWSLASIQKGSRNNISFYYNPSC